MKNSKYPDLATSNPELVKEWHPSKNGNLSPTEVSQKSGKNVWWICEKGHEWQAKVYTRTNGHGCPYCSGNKVLKGYNDLASVNPQLAHEWHPSKNIDLTPDMVSPNSNKKVWWLGSCGHEWEAKIESRFQGSGCPFCSNQIVLAGFNDLKTKDPELAEEWDYEKNGDLKPDMVAPFSAQKVWWKGKCGHEWVAAISHRSNDRGCPYCSNKKILKGFNDLASVLPELAREWHPVKNGKNRPETIVIGSHKKVWWICPKGHEWKATVKDRASGNQCPICQNRELLIGYNDLGSLFPQVAEEWNFKKNGNLKPEMVLAGSHKKVWWTCKKGHEWQTTVVARTRGSGCPVCANQMVLPGYNDLLSIDPDLASEWHPTKNGELRPNMVAPQSNIKVWWLGKCGHEWNALVSDRTNGRGCPICNREKHSSFPEQALFYYIKKCFPDAVNGDKKELGMELDIFVPSLRIAVEYDGYNWHNNKDNEIKKNRLCQENGVFLIRIREEGLEDYEDCFCIERKNTNSNDSLNEIIVSVLENLMGVNAPDIDVSRDEAKIYESYIFGKKTNSLAVLYPEIASEWHPTKNGLLSPEAVAAKSMKKVWWLGKCGHEWQSTVASRTSRNGRCPYCSNKRILKGFNDLETINPELAKEWNAERNGELKPSGVSPKSSKKVWWICEHGHEWQATVNDRANGTKCPECRRLMRKST